MPSARNLSRRWAKALTVTWPVGAAGKGNDGITALIKQAPGSIGYVEYGYAINNRLKFGELEHKSGEYVQVAPEAGAAMLSTAQFPADLLHAWAEDPEGKGDYPIGTFTWLLLYKKYNDQAQGKALKDFVRFGLAEGQNVAGELGYIPLPKGVIDKDLALLEQLQ